MLFITLVEVKQKSPKFKLFEGTNIGDTKCLGFGDNIYKLTQFAEAYRQLYGNKYQYCVIEQYESLDILAKKEIAWYKFFGNKAVICDKPQEIKSIVSFAF